VINLTVSLGAVTVSNICRAVPEKCCPSTQYFKFDEHIDAILEDKFCLKYAVFAPALCTVKYSSDACCGDDD